VNRSPHVTLALIAVVAIVAGGCAGPVVAVEGRAVPATATTAAVPTTPMDDYINEIASHTEMSWTESRSGKLNLGWAICADAPKKSRDAMITKFTHPPKPWSAEHAAIVIDAAKRHLCPATPWAPVSTYVPPSLEEATRVGPLDTIKIDGTWRVGTGQNDHVVPGRYRTNGSTGIPTCYYAKLDPADPDHILSNSLRDGPREVQLNEGDLFETQDCGTWTRQ
jgi:hypothetical protein